MTFPCVKCKIHKHQNTQIQKYKVLKIEIKIKITAPCKSLYHINTINDI